jgi:hypothetical protein
MADCRHLARDIPERGRRPERGPAEREAIGHL